MASRRVTVIGVVDWEDKMETSQVSAGIDAPTPESSREAGSVFSRCYRAGENSRIVAALLARASLLIAGGPGFGKSTLAHFVAGELRARGYTVALVTPRTAKQVLVDLAEGLGLSFYALDGRTPTSIQLQDTIAEALRETTAFILIDDAHRLPVSLRAWLEELLAARQPIVLFATHPPRKDIFLKLGRIELRPLNRKAIREIMEAEAAALGLQLNSARLAFLHERCGGNPMLARRVVREEHLGLEDTSPDHSEWIDGTPLLIAGLLIFTVLRFIGTGLHSTDLYLLGGVLTVTVGIVRVLIFSLPRSSQRIGG
jgi:hypothetical protein